MRFILFSLFCLWASATGSVEAVLWSRKASEAFTWNEHVLLVIQRLIVLALFIAGFYTTAVACSYYKDILLFGSIILAFSFFHNGFYFETRKRIDKKDYHFWSNATGSTAVFEFNFITRTIMFIVSLTILFL